MLSRNKLNEIREHLERAQNPLFFFDNDVDGLCSFLILRRAIDRGKGVAIKSFPDLKEQYLRKVDELGADYIFVLDKAEVSREFVEGAVERNIPVVWIDHHSTNTPKEVIEKTFYYSSFPTCEPTTYIAQKCCGRKDDLWLAVVGCIGDTYMPDFAKDFEKMYPEAIDSTLSAFDALYLTEVGRVARMLNFGLMETTTNVVRLIKYLFKARGIYDVLEENAHTRQLHKRYAQLKQFYDNQIRKAEERMDKDSKILFFSYSGQISMSSEIANGLWFRHRDKIVVVAFLKEDKVNISIRGKHALKITKEVVERVEGAKGGGHEEATGAVVPRDKFEEFKKMIIEAAKEFM